MPFISKTYNVTWNKKIPVQQKDWIVLSNLLFCSFHPSNVGLNVPFLETKAPGHLFDCFFLIPFKRWTSLSWPRALWLVCQSIQPLFNQWTLTMWHASALCFLLDAWRIPIRVLGWKCPAPVKLHASEWMSMRHSWRAAWNKLDDLKIDWEGGFRRWKIRSPFFVFRKEEIQDLKNDFSCLESLLSHWFCPASTTFLGSKACLRPTSNSQRLFADLRKAKKCFEFCWVFCHWNHHVSDRKIRAPAVYVMKLLMCDLKSDPHGSIYLCNKYNDPNSHQKIGG